MITEMISELTEIGDRTEIGETDGHPLTRTLLKTKTRILDFSDVRV